MRGWRRKVLAVTVIAGFGVGHIRATRDAIADEALPQRTIDLCVLNDLEAPYEQTTIDQTITYLQSHYAANGITINVTQNTQFLGGVELVKYLNDQTWDELSPANACLDNQAALLVFSNMALGSVSPQLSPETHFLNGNYTHKMAVVYKSDSPVRTAAHMFGHVVGLEHSKLPVSVMSLKSDGAYTWTLEMNQQLRTLREEIYAGKFNALKANSRE